MILGKILIATFNILANIYCTPDAYQRPDYNPEDLKIDVRYSRILNKIKPIMKSQGVLCFQEVDVTTYSKLRPFFKEHDYDMYYSSYRGYFGEMGVAIALPSAWKVKSLDQFRLIDGKKWPEVNTQSSCWKKVLDKLTGGMLKLGETPYENWMRSQTYNHTMVTLELEGKEQQSLFVSCIHMPCAFRYPSIMTTFGTLAMERIQKLAGKNPYVLAGDFNFMPDNFLYQQFTTGTVDPAPVVEDFPKEDQWNPAKLNLKPMKSALKEFNGKEPKWTNYAFNKGFVGSSDAKPFMGTLDYIFTSKHFTVKNAFKEPKEDKLCPNEKEPSDHIMIWANLSW